MIKCFDYRNAKGETATRICNVVQMSDTEYRGFDYNKLSQDEQSLVTKIYGSDHVPGPVPTERRHMTEEDYRKLGISKELFTKAYRIFKKANIIVK